MFASVVVYRAVDRQDAGVRHMRQQTEFHHLVEDIEARFGLYAYGLRTLRNFAMSGLTRESFDRFVNSKNLSIEFPGARGIGIVHYLKPGEENHFLLEKRVVDGYQHFRLTPGTSHYGPRLVLEYAAPPEIADVIGLDISLDSVRRHAAMVAVERNAVTLTGPVQLTSASANSATGLVAYLPIFKTNMPLSTQSERLAALQGWASAPMTVASVFADILARYNGWRITIVDEELDSATPIYDAIANSTDLRAAFQKSISIHGRLWRIRGMMAPDAVAQTSGSNKLLFAIATLLLFGLASLTVFARTRHRAKEHLLTTERSRLADIVEHASDAMLSTDSDGRILSWNLAATRLFGLDAQAAEGLDVRTLFGFESEPLLSGLKAGRELPEGGLTIKTMCKRCDETKFPAMISFFALRNDTRQLGISVRDMSDQHAFEECILKLTHQLQAEIKERTAQLDQSLALQVKIQHLAMHDPLTGLPNRTLFRERLVAAVELHTADPSKTFALLALDLDRFKPVNDTYGHPIGDALLTQIALRLRSCISEKETAARLGGDEFAILLEAGTSKERAVAVAMRVLNAIDVPFDVEGLKVEIGVSVGIALHDATTKDVDADGIFKLADHALYEAKHNGRHGYHLCTNVEDVAGPHASRLALEMRQALRQGEFHLQYQPIVDSATGRLDAFEALLRWNHPSRGPISPVEFIPVAEESDQIIPLGAWALRTACAEAVTWDSDVNVSVNVSPLQIKRAGWDDSVIAIVEETGIDPTRLTIEVTESVLMGDSDQILARLQRLQDYGIAIALDDFGTGFSSLSYLRKFRFNKLKIDKSFMRDSEDVVCGAIIRCIVRLGRQLSMNVVAEGIETERQLKLIEREGCSHGQGYFFSKPLDPPAARAFIARTRTTEMGLAFHSAEPPLRKFA